jgi:hypothetical protein
MTASRWDRFGIHPKPGTPATYHIGSDSYAMTIVGSERNGRTLLVTFAHNVTDVLGPDPTAEALAEYVAVRLKAERHAAFGQAFRRFTLRTDGRYRAQGAPGHGGVLSIGEAVDYRDPSF